MSNEEKHMFDQSMVIEIYYMLYWSCTAHTLAINVVCDTVAPLIAVFSLAGFSLLVICVLTHLML